MFDKEIELLLQKKWSQQEYDIIKKLISNLSYYRKLLPKSLKQDITEALQMCNLIKIELDKYRELCSCLAEKLEQVEENVEENVEEKLIESMDTDEKN